MGTSSSRAAPLRAVLVSLILGGALLYGGFVCFQTLKALKTGPAKSAHPAPRVAVRVLRAQRGTFRDTLRGYGRARSLKNAEVAAEIAAVVVAVDPALEAGNDVRAGQLLVTLDEREHAQALESATAFVEQRKADLASNKATLQNLLQRLKVARRELEISKRRLESALQLERSSASARDEVDQQRMRTANQERIVLGLEEQVASRKSSIRRLEAELKAAEAQRRRAALNVERCHVRAPFAGTIVERLIQVGARAAPGTPLFRIVDLSRVEVPIKLGAGFIDEVSRGSPACLKLSEDGEPVWTGRVARVSPIVDAGERTFEAFLEVERGEAGAFVLPGAFVMGEIRGRAYEGVIPIPREAFVGDRVFVVETDAGSPEEAVVASRRPRVLRMLPETALVTDGLEDGDLVVVTNLEELSEGMRVIVAPAIAVTPADGEGR